MNITAITTAMAAVDMPIGERLVYGLQVFAIGICTVFAVLALLWGVLIIFRLVAYDIPNKKKKAAEAAAAANAPAVPAVEDIPLAADAYEPSADDETQLIAVITAAIEAYSASNGQSLPFRVVSYRRVKSAGGWQGKENNETF